jgi:cytochrome c oxidase subunit 2
MSRFTLPLFPEQASTVATGVDHVFYFLLGISAFFTLLIAGLIAVFMVRFRRRSPDGIGIPVRPSLALEAAWTGIPLGIVMIIFFWGASIFATMQHPPADAVPINVVGKQWMWKLQHMDGRREINELHIPVGRPVKLTMTSEDVIHSFFVPAFRTKQDVVPGRYTRTWFQATKVGTYHLFCAEYCGTIHSGMIGQVVVMEPADYEQWLSGRTPGGPADLPPAAAGEVVFDQQGCPSCHRGDASGSGPSLAGLFGRSVRLGDGTTVVADDEYIRESILDPGAKVVAGYQPIMPTYQGLLGEEAIMQLIAYIKSLRAT